MITSVNELGINTIKVDENYYTLDWYSPTLMTPSNIINVDRILR